MLNKSNNSYIGLHLGVSLFIILKIFKFELDFTEKHIKWLIVIIELW